MVQLREFLIPFLGSYFIGFKRGTGVVKRGAPISAKNATKYFVDKGMNKLNKSSTQREGPGIVLTNNGIKDIIKLINSLENRLILLKGTTEKATNHKGGFLGPLMRVGLPFMKSLLESEQQHQ